MPLLADSHIHLDDQRFDEDRAEVVARARAAGVEIQIVPAVDRESWGRIAGLVEHHQGVHGGYGLHPMFLSSHHEDHIDALPDWLESHASVAVGEIGLDFHVENPDRDRQQHFFTRQLDIALEQDLPVIVHARKSLEQVTLTLRRYKGIRGVVHSFSGSPEQAQQLIDIGFHLGIGGPVTYSRANRLHRIVADLPIEHLLLESDAPDQPAADHRGERNEPAWIGSVLRQVAELRGESEEHIAAATSANVRRLFKL